jgi:hypothetical protein
VRGSYRGDRADVAAHTSAVQVTIAGASPYSPTDADLVLDQIQGTMAYVDTLATPKDLRRHRRIRAGLERAYNRLHHQQHRAGIMHDHAHPHSAIDPHEH